MIQKEKSSYVTQSVQSQSNYKKQKLLDQKKKFVSPSHIQSNDAQNDDDLIEIKLKKLIMISHIGKKIRKDRKTES